MSSSPLPATDFNSRRSAVDAPASGWTREKEQAVRDGYAQGERVRDIAARIGMNRNQVVGKADRLGLRHSSPYLRAGEGGGPARLAKREAFTKAWNDGLPVEVIAAQLNIQPQSVRDRARDLGLAPRPARNEVRIATAQARINAAKDGGLFARMTRNAIICFKREAGLTLEEIGGEYGITRERVRQICLRNGVVPARQRKAA